MPSEGKDSSGHNEDDEALRPYYMANGSDEEVEIKTKFLNSFSISILKHVL